MTETDFDLAQRDIIREEYFHLQKTVEEFDARTLTIKAWSVTVSATAVSAAYTEHQPILLAVGGVTALLFWSVEILWKLFQQSYYFRIVEIEEAFASRRVPDGPRIYTSWSQTFRAQRIALAWRVMRWPHVLLPHVGVALLAVLLLVLEQRYGWTRVDSR